MLTLSKDGDFNEADFGIMNEGHPDEVVLDPRSSTGSTSSKDVNQFRQNNPLSRSNINGQNLQSSRSIAPHGQHGEQAQAPQAHSLAAPQTPSAARPAYTPQNRGPPIAQNQRFHPQRSISMGQMQVPPLNGQPHQRLPQQPLPPFQPEQASTSSLQQVSTPPRNQSNPPNNQLRPQGNPAPTIHAPTSTDIPPQVGFFTAKAAESLQQNVSAIPPNIKPFNPHAESPSIRKTPGIDHTKTAPVNRDTIGATAQSGVTGQGNENGNQGVRYNPPPRITSNFVNPQGDQNRRIGMPGMAPSPLQNRHSYKPPQMLKRPAEGNGGV